MNVTTGTIHPKDHHPERLGHVHHLPHRAGPDRRPDQEDHLILDNGSSHTSKQTHKWIEGHPRFTVTYTPTHASWLNMVEIFFSILTRRMLRRGDFASRDDLGNKITDFIEIYNGTAKPFRWTYDAKLLKAA